MRPDSASILAERMRRHHLSHPLADPHGYAALFRALQPVATMSYAVPGSAPRLVHRTTFDDAAIANRLRSRREIVKGRFMSGNIQYVLAADLELYANAFCKPLWDLSGIQSDVLEMVETLGPLTPRQLREESGYMNKEIMPALHRLQRAFLVYEDQVDDDWERSWYGFAGEWPDIAVDPEQTPSALRQALTRFLAAQVFATYQEIRDWSGMPAGQLKTALAHLQEVGAVLAVEVDELGQGWMLASDPIADDAIPPRSCLMLHKGDPLVRPQTSALKARFAGLDVLQYLLIDGRFQGAVCGRWGINPYEVDDIALLLPAAERAARRDEILDAVLWGYQPPDYPILRYDEKAL